MFTKEEAEALYDLVFYARRTSDEADAEIYDRIAKKLDSLIAIGETE